MKKTFAFLLCIALFFFFIRLPMSATGTIQYKAILETEPEVYKFDPASSVSDTVYNAQCFGVVVYSHNVEDEPPIVDDDFSDFEEKILVLSDVAYRGYIGCRELHLFGGAKLIMENMIISGSSSDGTSKPALSEADLGNYENFRTALEGVGKRYTITSDSNIDYPLFCEDLQINEDVTLTLDSPNQGDGINRIAVSHSLIVNENGSLEAVDGQTLEIREGCKTIVGLTLYEDDGITEFTGYGVVPEIFEYCGGKWVHLPSGPPPISFNDNEFVVSFDDFTPHNGQAPEVKYRIDGGSDTKVARDETIQFFRNGDNTIASVTFSMKPTQFEDDNHESFYRVCITQGNDPDHPVEYSIEDDAITYDSDTNTYFFTVAPVQKGSDYEGFQVEIFWTEEAYNSGPGGPGGEGPQNTYTLTLDYNSEDGNVCLDRFDGNGPMFEPPGSHQVFEGTNVRVQIEPARGYIIQEVRIDGGEPIINEQTQESVTEYTFENITANHTLSVTFVRPEYTITVTHSGNGQVEVQNGLGGMVDGSAVTYTLGDNEHIRFHFIPNNGYAVSEILVDGQFEVTRDEYEFNNIQANHTLHVVFDKKGDGRMHTIIVTGNEGGTVESEGLDNGSILVENMFSHTFTFTPAPGYHLKSVIASGEDFELDMTYYGVEYNGDGSFTLTLEEVFQDMTLNILFERENAKDITFKKYVITENNDTPEKVARALAKEFGYITYLVDPDAITVENIDTSGIDTLDYGTFNFSVTIGGALIEEQGFIVPTHEYIIFEFDGTHGENPVDVIQVLTPEGIENMEFGVPAMDSGSIRLFGANGIRFEGVLSTDVWDAFIDGTRNEAVIGRAFYRAEWHISNACDMFDPQSLNLFGLNLIQDDAFCVQVAASDGGYEQRTYNWDLNRYAQLTTGSYTSNVFFGNDIFTFRLPSNDIGGVDSLFIETGEFVGYTVSEDANNHYTLTFLSDFYDNITLNLLINGEVERELTIQRLGVEIQEVEKRSDSDFANVFHGTQNGTHITFNGQNNYQLFATYYIPDFGDTAPFGLFVTYTWANGTTTTQIITQPETDGNANTGSDFDGVFRDDGYNNWASCCDYRLYTGPDKSAAPIRVNVIVLEGNPLDADTFGGVSLGSGKGVEWNRED